MIRLQNINLTPPEDKIEDATTFLDLAINGSLGNVFGIYENK